MLSTFRIHISPEGQLNVFADKGTFEERAPQLAALLQTLADNGIAFESVGAVEQHRHDDPRDRLLAASGLHTHGDGHYHQH